MVYKHIWKVKLSSSDLKRLLNDGWIVYATWPLKNGSTAWDLCKIDK